MTLSATIPQNRHYEGMDGQARTLNQWRKVRELKAQELADRAGITLQQLQPYLRGREPGVTLGLTLAEVLSVNPKDVLWRGQEQTPDLPSMPPLDAQGRVTPEQIQVASLWLNAGKSKSAIAKAIGVSRQTLYMYLNDAKAHGELN